MGVSPAVEEDYNYFRDYDPAIGRYIESDPIGLDGGLNTFGYVSGKPLKLIDPKGLASGALGGLALGCGAITICYFVPSCRKSMEDGTRNLISAISAAGSGSGSGSSSGTGSGSGSGPAACSNCPPPEDPCDKPLNDKFLRYLNIDPHSIKRDMVPGGGWGSYNLCGCKDGRIVLKRGSCDSPGGEDTGEFWK